MFHIVSQEPVDYLAIGHITIDLTDNGPVFGGSVLYAALTARALGLRVGIVTVRGHELKLPAWEGIQVVQSDASASTTFENLQTETGRVQILHHQAPQINFESVPKPWRNAAIIHLAPVAQELEPILPDYFHPHFLGLTPQGWLRKWDETGRVLPCEWKEARQALNKAASVVLSVEDVQHQEEVVEQWAHETRLLAVTEGKAGARLFWNGDSRRFRAPAMQEVDSTGAGDIFAASFFVRLMHTRDPWEAARFAVLMASHSVQRPGLTGIANQAEIQSCLTEVLQ